MLAFPHPLPTNIKPKLFTIGISSILITKFLHHAWLTSAPAQGRMVRDVRYPQANKPRRQYAPTEADPNYKNLTVPVAPCVQRRQGNEQEDEPNKNSCTRA